MSNTERLAGGGSSRRSTKSYGSVESDGLDEGGCHASGNNIYLTAGIILADVVGAGVLGIPRAFAQLGWLLGSILLIFTLVINVHVVILMWRVYVACPGARNYAELVDRAFAGASSGQRTFMRQFVWYTQAALFFGILCLYTLVSARSFGSIFHDVHWCFPVWAAVAGVILCPVLSSSPALGSWQSLIFGNAVLLLVTIAIPIVSASYDAKVIIERETQTFSAVGDVTYSTLLSSMSTLFFAFCSQFMIVEIMAEMRDPSEFPRAYVGLSAPYQLLLFLGTGLFGYYYVGGGVSGFLVDSMPFGMALRVTSFTLFLNMASVYVVKGVVFTRMVHDAIWGKKHELSDSQEPATWYAAVILVTVSTYVAVQLVPFFSDLVELIAGTALPVLCHLVPIVMFLRWQADFGTPADAIGLIEKGLIACEVLVALTLLIAGSYYSMRTIVQSWSTYGYPFDCHCEGMWNTCACSGGRPGMEEFCAATLH